MQAEVVTSSITGLRRTRRRAAPGDGVRLLDRVVQKRGTSPPGLRWRCRRTPSRRSWRRPRRGSMPAKMRMRRCMALYAGVEWMSARAWSIGLSVAIAVARGRLQLRPVDVDDPAAHVRGERLRGRPGPIDQPGELRLDGRGWGRGRRRRGRARGGCRSRGRHGPGGSHRCRHGAALVTVTQIPGGGVADPLLRSHCCSKEPSRGRDPRCVDRQPGQQAAEQAAQSKVFLTMFRVLGHFGRPGTVDAVSVSRSAARLSGGSGPTERGRPRRSGPPPHLLRRRHEGNISRWESGVRNRSVTFVTDLRHRASGAVGPALAAQGGRCVAATAVPAAERGQAAR